jgi:hypothetical protein
MGLNKSLTIIINLYKKGKISEDDTVQLIEDLYNKSHETYWYPWYVNTTNTEPYKIDYTITC